MKLFEITLPEFDNDGKSYHAALELWEDHALGLAGGYTKLASQGAWRDDASGKIYREYVQTYYRVTTDADTWHELVVHAFRIFPDQIAIMHAQVGEATIAMRAAPVHHVMPADTGVYNSKGGQ